MKKRNITLYRDAVNRPKEVHEILQEQLYTAQKEHERPSLELFLSAFTAGLEIGFSVFFMGIMYTLFAGEVTASQLHLIVSVFYPIGFIFVIIGKSQLFTEHTTLAVMPVLNRDASIRSLLRLWGIIYGGNILGGLVFAVLLALVPAEMGLISDESLVHLAAKLTGHRPYVIFGSGVIAGWLMGLLSWLVTSSQETISRIFQIFLVTTVIGIGSLHHSIVGSIEVFSAMLIDPSITFSAYGITQIWSTLGNLAGGVIFVAFIKFSHVRPGKEV